MSEKYVEEKCKKCRGKGNHRRGEICQSCGGSGKFRRKVESDESRRSR